MTWSIVCTYDDFCNKSLHNFRVNSTSGKKSILTHNLGLIKKITSSQSGYAG